jgi:hypothetical protein
VLGAADPPLLEQAASAIAVAAIRAAILRSVIEMFSSSGTSIDLAETRVG